LISPNDIPVSGLFHCCCLCVYSTPQAVIVNGDDQLFYRATIIAPLLYDDTSSYARIALEACCTHDIRPYLRFHGPKRPMLSIYPSFLPNDNNTLYLPVNADPGLNDRLPLCP